MILFISLAEKVDIVSNRALKFPTVDVVERMRILPALFKVVNFKPTIWRCPADILLVSTHRRMVVPRRTKKVG